MSFETYRWLLTVHTYAILVWAGSLIGLCFILKQHGVADKGAHKDFVALEKGTAITMDIGATIAMAVGVYLLLAVEPSPLKQPWMHAKLTFVAIFLAIHVLVRMRVGKAKRGEVSQFPPLAIAAAELALAGIVVMVIARPF